MSEDVSTYAASICVVERPLPADPRHDDLLKTVKHLAHVGPTPLASAERRPVFFLEGGQVRDGDAALFCCYTPEGQKLPHQTECHHIAQVWLVDAFDAAKRYDAALAARAAELGIDPAYYRSWLEGAIDVVTSTTRRAPRTVDYGSLQSCCREMEAAYVQQRLVDTAWQLLSDRFETIAAHLLAELKRIDRYDAIQHKLTAPPSRPKFPLPQYL